jgi:hypothetical protein
VGAPRASSLFADFDSAEAGATEVETFISERRGDNHPMASDVLRAMVEAGA